MKVLGVYFILFDSATSVWMPWWHEDFTSNPQLEDDYVGVFGNEEALTDDEDNYQEWTTVRHYYNGTGVFRLIRFCALAHQKAGRGTVAINAVKLNARKLTFQNPFYESRMVDVLTYGVKNETDITTNYWDMVVGTLNYMTEGLRPDCVCYLTLLSSLKMEFSLYEHVCGLNVTGITDVQPKRKLTMTTQTTSKRTTIKKKVSTTKKASTKKKASTTKKSKTTTKSVPASGSTRKGRRKTISDTWS